MDQVGYAPLIEAQDADDEVVPSHRAGTSQVLLSAFSKMQHDRMTGQPLLQEVARGQG